MSDIYSDEFPSGRGSGPLAFSPAFTRAAGAALFLALAAGMGGWAWKLGTRDAAEVPIIRAMEGPARVQPAEPGGEVAPHQGLEVNAVLAGEPAAEPEAVPARIVAPAVTLQPEDAPKAELLAATPQIPVLSIPEAGDLRMPVADEGPEVAGRVAEGESADAVAALIEAALRAEAGAADAEADASAVAAGPRPLSRPSGLATRPARQPALAATAPASQPVLQRTAFAPAPAAPAPVTPAPVATTREVASVAPGSRLVQLGAFDSEGLARQVWGQLTASHGDLLGSRSLLLERATHNARVFYRLRVAGFASADETRILCEQLRTRGVDCIPVQPN